MKGKGFSINATLALTKKEKDTRFLIIKLP